MDVPTTKLTDMEMGLMEINRIMPDTWHNISWLVTSSVETIIKEAIESRRNFYSLKEFSTK
jgi:hypothetical protein